MRTSPRGRSGTTASSTTSDLNLKSCLLSLLLIASATCGARADDLKVLNDDAHFAEGPIWYHGKLYYVRSEPEELSVEPAPHRERDLRCPRGRPQSPQRRCALRRGADLVPRQALLRPI